MNENLTTLRTGISAVRQELEAVLLLIQERKQKINIWLKKTQAPVEEPE